MIPTLMITFDRLKFTQFAVARLLKIHNCMPVIIDNGSTDGTVEWLKDCGIDAKFNKQNIGIAGAMNQFLKMTDGHTYVAKIDNDTLVYRNFIDNMLPHMKHADIVQAKHAILKATHPGGFDAWVAGMRAAGALRFNHFVGGTGIMFNRKKIGYVPETEWKLGGWRQMQRDRGDLIKAFATDVQVVLLDTDDNGANYPEEYKDYYVETKRLP